MKKAVFLFASLFLCLTSAAFGQDAYQVLDYQVNFFIENAGITVEGNMEGLEADIQFHARKPSKSSVNASLDPTTIDTGIRIRDNHLRRADYFDVKQYPEITLKSTGFEKTGKDQAVGTFVLTIKGISKKIEIPVQYQEEGENLIFSANFTINRLDFGLGEESIILSDDVEVKLIAQLHSK